MMFCDRHEVVEYRNIRDFANDLACVYPSLKACTSASPGGGFQGRLGALELDELSIFSCAYTPMHSEVGHRESIEVRLPILGYNLSKIDGKSYHWGSGLGALFTPAKVGNANQEGGCTLFLLMNEARLEKTAHAMLGLPPHQPLNLQLEQPRVMPLHLGKIDIIRSFQQMSHLLAPYRKVPAAIAAIGVEDFVYRHAVLMLRPDLFQLKTDSEIQIKPKRRELDVLCDTVQSKLQERITLTDMELISGLSSRSLQIGFAKRFGMGPMQWLREQRLSTAHRILNESWHGTSILGVALNCGFSAPSKFSAFYKLRFGESPSTTLAKALER